MSSFKVFMCASSVGVLSYLLFIYYRRRNNHDISSEQVDRNFSDAVLCSSEDANTLTKRDAYLLTSLLVTDSADNDKMMQQKILTTIGNKAAFTQNQNILREVGCLRRLTELVKSYSLSLITEDRVDMDILYSLLGAVNNLAMNEANQTELQACIPALTLIVSWHSITNSSVTLAALQALTNLAVTSSYHSMYSDNMQIVSQLALSSSATSDVRLQSMKLLVNLTANRDMACRLIAVQNPLGFVRVLDEVKNPALTLRTLNVLVNLHTALDNVKNVDSKALLSVIDARQDVTNQQSDCFVLRSQDSSPMTQHFIRPEYLRHLHLKLDSIVPCNDPDVRALCLRLVSLLPATSTK